ncbi:hypothetical protein [uncultured Secundilactobacillus sp.]|uniref:hypothetical protein n=1 Tax=uncultured Secundilactobacillus sp. TaxID=2813935 RepID=UPI00258CE3DD|nr:hypothetical protein [uncultured Secundilactobacillus sp.]
MIQGNFIYINWEQVTNLVISYGISDADFVNGISEIPTRLVLINDQTEGNQFNNHTRFQTVNGQSFVREFLLNSTVQDKMWLDYHDPEDLDLMMPSEIAELLYMAHMKTHLHIPLYAKLQNEFTYLSVSRWLTKIYYRNLRNFFHVLDVSMKRHLRAIHSNRWVVFNRGLAVNDVSNDVLKQLASIFSEGAIIAFNEFHESSRRYQIPVLVQQHPEHSNWWRDQQDMFATADRVATLNYDVDDKRWSLTILDPVPFENDAEDL